MSRIFQLSLNNLSDTVLSGIAENQILQVNASGLWENRDSLTLSGLTQGSVVFAGVNGLVSQDNSNLFWDDTNNRLGIGINSPEVKLHIKNSGASVQLLLQSLEAEDATIRIRNGSSSKWTFGNDASNDEFMISTGSILGDPKLTILQGGNVGIGTTAPNAPLEVKGAKPAGNIGGFQSGMFHVTGSGDTEFSNSVITGHSAYNTNTQLWYLGSMTASNNDIAFINRQNAAMHFSTNNTSRMTIDAAGDVLLAGSLTLNGTNEYLDLSGISNSDRLEPLIKFSSLTGWSTWLGGGSFIANDGVTFRTGGKHITTLIADATANTVFAAGVKNEAYPRLQILGTGGLVFGQNGTAVPNANLYSSVANILKTDDAFTAGALITGSSGFFAPMASTAADPEIKLIGDSGLYATTNEEEVGLSAQGVRFIEYVNADGTLDLYAGSSINLGNPGTTELKVEADGDTYWVGAGTGLPYGEAQQTDEATFNVTMTTVNVWVEVDAATTNITAPELNLVTFPDDHYLLCEKAGHYLVTYSFTAEINSVAGGDQHVESGIMVNDTIQTDKGIGHEQYAAINKERNLQGHTIIDVPTNGQVSLAIKNTTSSGKILTIDHLNITVTQVGGR